MRKAHILTTEKISQKALDEVAELIPAIYTVEQTKELIPKKWNPYHASWWGDFDWLRSKFDYGYDTRCYATSQEKLVKQGVTKNIGMYDMVDNDGVLDFYIAMPRKLDKRAKANGFKTNFAWLYCHETAHGKEQLKGTPDRVHTMEKQGRLKELLAEYRKDDMEAQISVLQKILNSLLASLKEKPHKLFDKSYPVTQAFGVYNPIYTKTQTHIGVDYATPLNTPIYAPYAGTVTKTVGKETGNVINLKTAHGTFQFLHTNDCIEGTAKKGDIIGYTGNTGQKTTGAHVCVRHWVGEPDISILTRDNIHTYLLDVQKLGV